MIREYRIRKASVEDLDSIAKLEKCCFPEEEAASEAAFSDRLKEYPSHFWMLETDGRLVSMINGMVTDEPDLRDEMYNNAALHNENGSWQMIFGVETHPAYQKNGYASILMRQVIEDAEKSRRAGLVLTCKEQLIPFYEQFGFENEGVSASEHGNAVWYQMRKRLCYEI